MKTVLGQINGYNNLDYIACWFAKAAKYIEGTTSQFSFVSTNSITQGTQVAILWPHILELLEIGFCHQSFKWSNHAKGNAGVTCIIVGVRNGSKKTKFIYTGNIKREAENISPYLADTNTLYINSRR